jgi:lipid-A-disaccharide synthase
MSIDDRGDSGRGGWPGDCAAAAPAIMLVAGEPSGDHHAAPVCRALRRLVPGVRLFGLGGPSMVEAGLTPIADMRDLAVVGFTEVVRRLPALRRLFRLTADALRTRRPCALVLVDYPGFNLRLAAEARRAGVPVIYFIPPQVWAWRAGRIAGIRASVDLVLAVFRFEAEMYRAAGVAAEFVGHPLVDEVGAVPPAAEARRQLGLGEGDLVVGLLPGSRSQEIARMTPLLGEAAARLARVHPRTRFVLAQAPGVMADAVRRHLPPAVPVQLVQGHTGAVIRAADLLLVASGTATLEAALLGTPMVICYRVSRVSEAIARRLVRIPWVGLANIVLGRRVVPELCLRRDATPERLAAEALRLLDTPGALREQREAFADLVAVAGMPGVAERVARQVLDVARVPVLAAATATGPG